MDEQGTAKAFYPSEASMYFPEQEGSATEKEERDGELAHAEQRLADQVQHLELTVAMLADRLRPILRPPSPNAEGGADTELRKVEETAPHTKFLEAQTARIASVASGIDRALTRLSV
jgi:hypothetical protein